MPEDAQKAIAELNCVVDFFYEPNVCVFCDGSVHDNPTQAAQDRKVRDELVSLGYRVIAIRYDKKIHAQLAQYPEVFGKAFHSD